MIYDSLVQKQSEQALRQSEQRFRDLANAMPLIVWIAKPDGAWDYSNQRWFDYTGTTSEQTQDWGWQSFLHASDRQHCLEMWNRAISTGVSYEVESRLRRSDGTYRWHLSRAVPLCDQQGQIIAWVGTATDIDDRKRAEEGSRFLSEASQELANSLDYQITLDRVARLAVPHIADWCAVDILEEQEAQEPKGIGHRALGRDAEAKLYSEVRTQDSQLKIRRLAVAHVDPSKVEWAQQLYERYPPNPNDLYGVPQVLRTGQSELYPEVPDSLLQAVAQDAEHLALLRQVGFLSAMVVPLIARGRTLGTITFVTAESGRQYTTSDLALGEELARRAALAVDNACLFKAVQKELYERQQVEVALRESEERFRTMADSAPVLLWVTDSTGLATFFNQVWLSFTGRSLQEELGNGWAEGVHPEDLQRCWDMYQMALQVRQPFTMEYRLRRADGVYRWILANGMPRLMPDCSFAGYIGSCVDITEQKLAQEALHGRASELARLTSVLSQTNTALEKRNQELDQFAYIVSHDLKAPLRAIANLSQWIEEDLSEQLSGDTKHQMDLLRGRVHRMEALIEGILQYSRVGRLKRSIEEVDVENLLQEILDSLAPPPTFTIAIQPGMPQLMTERLPLEQVFSNLIGNAIKHHDRLDGQVKICVQDQGDFYEFSVADDGPGILPQYHEKVFVIFQTLLARDKMENTGIGLSLVKKIVEDKGGRVWIESDIGKGAIFRFTWPKQLLA